MSRGRIRFVGRLTDPRLLLGLGITAASLWFALRGVDFRVLARDLARADLAVLLLPTVPALLASLYLRALRWGYLTEAIQPVPPGPLFRATAVGFLANNVFPLRIGEFVRAWYLSRDTGIASAAALGTIILERLLDMVVVAGLAAVVVGVWGAEALGVEPARALPLLLTAALVPVVFVAALRLAPGRSIEAACRVAGRVLSKRLADRLRAQLHELADGLGSLRGGRHWLWIGLHSVLIWLVLAVIPFLAAFAALDMDFGGPLRALAAAYATLISVGAAVALPSAPGFFGPYHAACWVALAPFGVPKELALAYGTLCHASFWLIFTACGLAVLRIRRTPGLGIQGVAAESGKDPSLRSR